MQFVEHNFQKFGHRAVCLYTNRRERLSYAATVPRLRSAGMVAAYDVNPARIREFAASLRTKYDIAAIIPFNDAGVTTAAELTSGLGLNWAKPEVIRRFRDKFALKAHIRNTVPVLRINASDLVRTLEDVLSLGRQSPYQRFVLKPNDGFGNRHIGLFHRTSPQNEIRRYLRRLRGIDVVMEEYIDGVEYFVNGQIDARGHVTTLAMFEYVRGLANGRHNVDVEAIKVPHGGLCFTRLADYAESVMRATGLERTPFHLELKVDQHGPCLIEVGARLAGHGNAWVSGELHGPQLNLIELASHYYFNATDFGRIPVDWDRYNAQAVRYVHGIAHRRERLYDLDGIIQTEALPEFHGWVKKPRIGTHVERTVDALSMPWSLILKAPTETAAAAAASKVRDFIKWNRRTRRGARAALSVRFKVPRALSRLRQSVQLVLPPLSGPI